MHLSKRKKVRFICKRSMRRAVAVSGLAMGAMLSAHGQVSTSSTPTNPVRRTSATSVDARWQSSFDAFSAADQVQAPRPGGVLFVGSSSIRLWSDLEKSFTDQPIIVKRGFGGSRLSDCTQYVQRLVLPYKPRLVLVYAGDNDLAEGATPQQVLESYIAFVRSVHAELPNTRIAYLSIKPSPLREALMPAARQTNALIEAYSHTQAQLDYIDVYSRMLNADGRPRTELFGPDLLHLNEAGYALWKREIASHLTP